MNGECNLPRRTPEDSISLSPGVDFRDPARPIKTIAELLSVTPEQVELAISDPWRPEGSDW